MKKLLLFLLILLLTTTTAAWIRYGGGVPYPDLTTTPLFDASKLEEVLSYPEPIGSVAVSRDGRIFFSVHPESRPVGNKVLEFVNGAAVPYPSRPAQQEILDTVQALVVDRYDRLWIVDHGNHGIREPRIVAVDLATDEVLRDQVLDREVAPAGSFLQDLEVSADGQTIVIADASFWRKSPALIVYDVESGDARRVLEGNDSVSAEDYMIRSQGREMEFLGGVLAMRGGVTGLAMGPEWLYFSAISGSGLYRVRLHDLRNPELPPAQLATRVERFSDKPLSDGLSTDVIGNIYVTDVEHNAVFVVGPDRRLETLVQSTALRWPDALSFGPGGYLYIADSALPELILRNREHIEAQAPFRVFRLMTGFDGVPGQ